ncbi:uncharacterized protein LOC120775636 [Bactrocera tryoni]|uniref:uncharacterized protein LOC120775636 n=1 Tax=Bactrocera tryoni TaxID=59916 RepID=UPI001A97F4BC|nr:uncharacterized protein LOC120775636 [Bactrocera tryoni]
MQNPAVLSAKPREPLAMVLWILSTVARADGVQPSDAAGMTDGDGETTLKNEPSLCDIATSGGDSAFSIEQLFEEVRVENNVSAKLELLEESLKDEIPPTCKGGHRQLTASSIFRCRPDPGTVADE